MTKQNLEKMVSMLWTNIAVNDCYKNLEENKDADAFETLAGSLCSMDESEEYQVKVIVTRNKRDFTGDLDHIKHVTKGSNKS